MLIYEITATVESEFADAYERYMADEHIADLMATGHFTHASIARESNVFRISYWTESQQQLDAYLANDAERLRLDAIERFPTGVMVERKVLEVKKEFGG